MKLPLAIALLVLLGCAANKPVFSQADNTGDDPCEIMREIQEWAKSQGFDTNQKYPYEDNDKCYCDTIICNNVPTCYAWHCAEGALN